jgi:hypothetical protein
MLAAVVVLTCAPAARADWIFTLDPPGGAVFGDPGTTVGWGYSVTNQSEENWLVLSGLSADAFAHATPDASLFDFPILAPGATLDVPYAAGLAGLFRITWDPTAPVGFTSSGTFVLSAEAWDGNPLLGGSFVSLELDRSAAYSATVSSSDTAAVPEPSALLLMIGGATGLLWRRRARPA